MPEGAIVAVAPRSIEPRAVDRRVFEIAAANQGQYSVDLHLRHDATASHEFAEATTDNIPTPGSVPDFPQAWNDVHGFEVGDLCSGFQGSLTDGVNTFEVTQYYLNSTRACSTGNYQSP